MAKLALKELKVASFSTTAANMVKGGAHTIVHTIDDCELPDTWYEICYTVSPCIPPEEI